MLITTALGFGLLISTIISVFIFVTLIQNPRIWLARRGTPQAIRDAVTPPLTEAEKRTFKLWAIPIFAVMFLMPLGATLWYETSYQQMNYGEAFLFLWLMLMTFNVVDLVIIDWFVLVWWQPAWSIIPEVKPLMQYAGYLYHFKGFLKGIVITAVMALIFAGIVMLI